MSLRGLISSANSGSRSTVVADIVPHTPYLPSIPLANPQFLSSSSIPSSMKSSLPRKKMDGHHHSHELGLIAENFDPGIVGRLRDDDYESTRSGSDNFEGASGDDQDAGDKRPPRKTKYHRHTPNQINELENAFKECPHPDEKQRLELSRKLGLETKQVKFWFQNRRTQMKTQLERHENIILKTENDKLRAENGVMKDAVSNPQCTNCGGPAIPGQVPFEEHQLRIENARLKDELNRICTLAHKLLGRPLSAFANSMSFQNSTSGLELGMGLNVMGGGMNATGTGLQMGLDLGDGISSSSPMMPVIRTSTGMMGNEVPNHQRSMYVDLALAAMDELVKMAQVDSPLWIKSSDGGTEVFNHEEYRAFSCMHLKSGNFVTEATRDTSVVVLNGLALIDALMDASRWREMFPCLVARASTIDMISNGIGGTRDGVLQVMHAELQVLSPFVPIRSMKFLRFCKQHAEGVWAVADVSIDINQESSNTHTFLNCRRLPSGCVVQEMANGCKVTWIEHAEYDESAVHHLFRKFVRSGMGFGAERWIATLKRQCECLPILSSSTINNEDPTGIAMNGKKNMIRLAQRMVDSYCSGVSASSVRKWDKICIENVSEDLRVMTRKSMNDPGEPPGIVLSATTSVWIPVSRQKLFDFLRDEQLRSHWDILSCSGGQMQNILQIAKSQESGNCVSLLRGTARDANESNMLILQETGSDASGSFIVYAPVETASITDVMQGGDPAYVAILPSGFAILPCGPCGVVKTEGNGSEDDGGCLLTVGFQILVNNHPSSTINMESIDTVRDLITGTLQKMKSAVQIHGFSA